MKALEITWTKPIDMHCILPYECEMRLFVAGFSSIENLYGEAGLKNSRLNRMF